MTTYTVAIREKGKSGHWLYVDDNLRCSDTATHCKPLSRADAEFAKSQLMEGAAKAGRPIICRIVRLVGHAQAA